MRTFTLISMLLLLFTIGIKAQDPATVNFSIIEAPLTEGDLPMTASGQQIWGDYNNDGLLDIFMITGQGNPFSALYRNNGNSTFTEVLIEVTMMSIASAVFFDADNDGDLDLLVAGSVDGSSTAVLTELYRNTGAPNYELVWDETAEFVGISAESGDNSTRLLEAVDYDNDGWTDIFLSGNAGAEWEVSGNARVVALYKNVQGNFELQTTPVDGTDNFISMNGGGIHCGDVNNDGYTDLIVSGYVDGDIQSVTDLYINNTDGTFSYFEDSRELFTGHTQGETFFVDINNDGWLDIVEIGRDVNNGWSHFANVFINNKNLTFEKTEAAENGLIGGGAVVAAGDLNNDGLVDLVVSGWGPNTTFFYNKGDGSFLSSAIDPDIARARAGCVNFVDIDLDGNLDFTIFGYRDGGNNEPDDPTWPDFLLINELNEGIEDNQAPSVPENVIITQEGENVIVSWDQSTDDTTPAEALRYNIFAKSRTGSEVFTYFPADVTNGKLTAATNGIRPLISGTSFTFKGKSEDDYTFGVQAIDNANMASAFSTPVVVSVKKDPVLENVLVIGQNDMIVLKNQLNSKISYSVISITGKEVVSGTCGAYFTKELRMAVPGVYIVKISDKSSFKTEKVVVY